MLIHMNQCLVAMQKLPLKCLRESGAPGGLLPQSQLSCVGTWESYLPHPVGPSAVTLKHTGDVAQSHPAQVPCEYQVQVPASSSLQIKAPVGKQLMGTASQITTTLPSNSALRQIACSGSAAGLGIL